MALRLLNGNAAKSTVLEPFDTVGNHCLVQFIGRGGMGEVWLAVERGTIRPVAIKFLLPELARDERNVESLRREAEIGIRLGGQPTIVGVREELGEERVEGPDGPERLLYLVLDWVDGVNLRRLAHRYCDTMKQTLPIPIVVHIVRTMLRALDAAHNHGIGSDALTVVHGDINPGNVLISSRGAVQVTDFGISRIAPEPTFISRPVGTLPYMAPEQYLGRICPQNDLYTVGAVLHELLTGKPPLPTDGSPRTRERKLFEDPVPSLDRGDVPSGLDRLRRGLLEKNVDLRIQTASEALALLAKADKTDYQDELKVIYTRMFGPSRSGVTKYLQAQGDNTGSFVVDLLRRHHRPVVAEPEPDAKTKPIEEPAPAGDAGPVDDDRDDDGDDMLWLVDDEDPPTTQTVDGPMTRLSPTLRLEGTIGEVPPQVVLSAPTVPETPPAANEPPSAPTPSSGEAAEPLLAPDESAAPGSEGGLAGPLLEPGDESELDVAVTTPVHRASPRPDPRRYPPRPPHLADGVPFQRRRAKKRIPLDESELDGVVEATRPSPPEPALEPASSSGPASGPQQTQHDAATGRGPTRRVAGLSATLTSSRASLVILLVATMLFALSTGVFAWVVLSRKSAFPSPPSRPPPATSTSG